MKGRGQGNSKQEVDRKMMTGRDTDKQGMLENKRRKGTKNEMNRKGQADYEQRNEEGMFRKNKKKT